MSVNINNWVMRSLMKHLTDGGLTLVPTGFHQNAPEKENLSGDVFRRMEFRLDGPYTVQRGAGKDKDKHEFEVNILITQNRQNNVYAMNDSLDLVYRAMNKNFCIFRIDEDNQTAPFDLIGTLKPYKSSRRQLSVHNFGQLESNSNIYQGVVVGRYYIFT